VDAAPHSVTTQGALLDEAEAPVQAKGARIIAKQVEKQPLQAKGPKGVIEQQRARFCGDTTPFGVAFAYQDSVLRAAVMNIDSAETDRADRHFTVRSGRADDELLAARGRVDRFKPPKMLLERGRRRKHLTRNVRLIAPAHDVIGIISTEAPQYATLSSEPQISGSCGRRRLTVVGAGDTH
jgi:hypothetical protein